MVKIIGTKEEIKIFLLQLQCPIHNEDLQIQECPAYSNDVNCLDCMAKEYDINIEYIL